MACCFWRLTTRRVSPGRNWSSTAAFWPASGPTQVGAPGRCPHQHQGGSNAGAGARGVGDGRGTAADVQATSCRHTTEHVLCALGITPCCHRPLRLAETAVSERYDDERGLSHARETAPPLDSTSLRMVHSSPGGPWEDTSRRVRAAQERVPYGRTRHPAHAASARDKECYRMKKVEMA